MLFSEPDLTGRFDSQEGNVTQEGKCDTGTLCHILTQGKMCQNAHFFQSPLGTENKDSLLKH